MKKASTARREADAAPIAQERMIDLLQAVNQEHDGLPPTLRPPLNALGEAIEAGASRFAELERDRRTAVIGLKESKRREAELRKRLRFSVERSAQLEDQLARRSRSDLGRGRAVLLAVSYLIPPAVILVWILAA
jgi:hypothetical protein